MALFRFRHREQPQAAPAEPEAPSPKHGMIDECGLRLLYEDLFTPDERAYLEFRQKEFPFTEGEYLATRDGDEDIVVDLYMFQRRFDYSPREKYLGAKLMYLAALVLEMEKDWYSYHFALDEVIKAANVLRQEY